MKPETLNYIIAMTCLIPVIVGIFRLHRIERKYHPFIYMMVLDSASETIQKFHNAGWILSSYLVLSFVLTLFLFWKNCYLKTRAVFIFSTAALLIAFVNLNFYEEIYSRFFPTKNPFIKQCLYLLCFTYTIDLALYIDVLSKQTTDTTRKLFNNFWFWISTSSIVGYAMTLLVYSLYFFALENTTGSKNLGQIQHFVNAICYLLYTVAILKIPSKNDNPKATFFIKKIPRYVA